MGFSGNFSNPLDAAAGAAEVSRDTTASAYLPSLMIGLERDLGGTRKADFLPAWS